MQKQWSKLLKGLNTKWKEAQASKAGGFATVEKGTYSIRVTKVSLGESQQGNPQVVWTMKVENADLDHQAEIGKEIWQWDRLDQDWGLSSLARRFEVLGTSLEDLEQIGDTLLSITNDKPLVKARVTHIPAKDGSERVFIKCTFERLLDADLEEEDAPLMEEEGDTDTETAVKPGKDDRDDGDADDDERADDDDEEEEVEEVFDDDDAEDQSEDGEASEDVPEEKPKRKGRGPDKAPRKRRSAAGTGEDGVADVPRPSGVKVTKHTSLREQFLAEKRKRMQ